MLCTQFRAIPDFFPERVHVPVFIKTKGIVLQHQPTPAASCPLATTQAKDYTAAIPE
jgi:hypothetical protein